MNERAPGISPWRTARIFLTEGACSSAVFAAVDEGFGQRFQAEERALSVMAGGLMLHGYQCGGVWGGALAAGVQAHAELGPGPEAEALAVRVSQELVESFRARNGSFDCLDITDTDMRGAPVLRLLTYFLLKGGSVGCIRMIARYAPEAFSEIRTSLEAPRPRAPSAPVSCAAELVRRMGGSEEHATMTAGLAGGIGLCGGACGALGAATWLLGLRIDAEGDVADLWQDAGFQERFADLVQAFHQVSDFEFECAEIVGRRFEDVEDHARFLAEGGCAGILDALVAATRAQSEPPGA